VASCNCGVDYKPKSVRAADAVKANPEKSDRAIAKEIGVSQPTVSKARKEVEATDKQLSVETRTGLDGKTRKVPQERAKHEEEGETPEEELFESLVRITKLEGQVSKLTEALRVKEKHEGRDWPADLTAKQIKQRDKCLGAIAYWQRELEKFYNEITGQPAWRVELVKGGVRYGNGLRFSTRDEAEFYRTRVAEDSREDCATAETIACQGEKGNVSVDGSNIRFEHGDCVLFDWRPVSADDAAASADKRKADHAALDGAAP